MNTLRFLCSLLMAGLCLAPTCSAQTATADTLRLWLAMRPSDLPTSAAASAFTAIDEALAEVNRLGTGDRPVCLYIAPGVYWLDNPDDPAVRRPLEGDGGTPFAQRIRCRNLTLVGTGRTAADVVLACNRGQTQGALGNYTMLLFEGRRLAARGITFGNYCNVDLDYGPDASLSRKKRADAIVQAQLGICRGTEEVCMQHCRFVSRLNLCPFVGAERARYDDCYFECTDDALNGHNALYNHCRFTLFSSRPFYATSGERGAVLTDCDILTHVRGRQFLTKAGGPLTLCRVRWTAADTDLRLAWSPGDEPYVCYSRDVTLNGRPVEIDRQRPWRTVVLTAGQPLPTRMVRLQPDHAVLRAEADTLLLRAEGRVVGSYVSHHTHYRDTVEYVAIDLPDHRRGVARVTVRGRLGDAPVLRGKPRVRLGRQEPQLSLSYQLSPLDGALDAAAADDVSEVTWYRLTRGGDTVAVQRSIVDGTKQTYRLRPADADGQMLVRVVPRRRATEAGTPVWLRYQFPPSFDMVPSRQHELTTDFSDVPLVHADGVGRRDVFLLDAFKPLDTAGYAWQPQASAQRPAWYYGQAPDGARGEGLVTAVRGARLMYRPTLSQGGAMSVELDVDPCKTAGQGFGSATGQYFDLGIKFDCATQCGYALRIERTPQYDRAVVFRLVRYDRGTVVPLTEAVVSGCFRTGCRLQLSYADGRLRATAHRPSDPSTPPVVLTAVVEPLTASDLYLQHTGTVGASALMLHRLRVVW